MAETVVRRLVAEMDARDVGMNLKFAEANKRIAELERKFTTLGTTAGRSLTPAARGASDMGQRFFTAGQQIAMAGETAARTGKLAGEAGRQMLAQGAQMVTFFGPHGALIGGLAIATMAFVEQQRRLRDEMKKTINEARKDLETMDLTAAARRQQQLFSGNRNAIRLEGESSVAFLTRQGGVEGLRARQAALPGDVQTALDAYKATVGTSHADRAKALKDYQDLVAEQKEVTKALATQEALYKETLPVVERLTQETVAQANNAAAIAAQEKSATDATKDRQKTWGEIVTAAKAAGKAGEQAIGELLERMQKDHADVAKEIEERSVEMTSTLVDDMQLAADRMLKALRDKGATDEQLAPLERWQQSLIGVQQVLEDTSRQLAGIEEDFASGAMAGPEAQARLGQIEDSLRRQIVLLGTSKETEAARLKLEEQLDKVLKARGTILGETVKRGKETENLTHSVASNIAKAADAGYGLAQALGMGNSEAAKMLTAIGAIARGIAAISEKGWGKLSTSDKIGAIGAIAGGVISLGSALAGESPEQKAHRELLARNNERLLELTSKIGLLGVALTGTDASAAQAVLARGRADGWDTLSADDWRILSEAAEGLRIEFDRGVSSLNRLTEALADTITKLGEFDNTFADWSRWFDAMQRANGGGSPSATLDFLKERGGSFSPAIASILDVQGDLSDPAVQAAIRQRVLAYLERAKPGGSDNITSEELGQLQGDEFIQVLMQILEQLDRLASSVVEKLKQQIADIDTESEILDLDPEQRFARRGEAYKAMGGALGDLFTGLDLTDPAAVAQLDERIRALFEQLKNAPQDVDLAGLSIEELIAILLDLDGAADQVAASVQTAAGKFAEAAGLLDTEFAIMGTGSVEQAQAIAGAAGQSFGSIGEALAGIDLKTADGRQRAIAALQSLYQANKSDKDLASAILSVLNAIRAVGDGGGVGGSASGPLARGGGSTDAVASGARNLTEVTGRAISDRLTAIQKTLFALPDRFAESLARVLAAPLTLTPTPNLPFVGAGGTVYQFRTVINVYMADGTLATGDAQRLGGEAGAAAVDAWDQGLGAKYIGANLRQGNVTRTGR